MKAQDARQGDVLLDGHGKVWQKTGDRVWQWATFEGMVVYYGDWKAEYGPVGTLTLLVRGGKPVRHEAGEQ
jgi:hypothetical protein